MSIVALSAAVGGAASKFTELTWDLAKNWLKGRFGDHLPAARARAQDNAALFVGKLARRVALLEQANPELKGRILEGQSDPHFALVLQKSILGAAQTDNATKHDVLAALVASRLVADADSTLALATGLACDVVPNLTSGQLRILALLVFVHEIRPRDKFVDQRDYEDWVATHLAPLGDPEVEEIDIHHLVALGCVTYNRVSEQDLNVLLGMKNFVVDGKLMTDFRGFLNDSRGVGLQLAWDAGLTGVDLSSVGSVVGAQALDAITGRKYGTPAWMRPKGA